MQGIYKTSAAMCASSKIFQWMNYLLTAYKCVFVKKIFTLQWQDYSPTFLSPHYLQKQTIPKY